VDGEAGLGDAGGVGQRQVALGQQRLGRDDLDLSGKENRFTGPAWADEAADWERRLQREWTPLIPEAVATREDQRNIEHDPGSDELPIGITFPHPALKEAGHPALLATPFSGEALTDVAIGAIHALKLGEDEIPDLLTVSYSHTDYIGHNFTAESAEALDNIIRLDRELGKLMKVLDEDVGKGRWTMVLSSDHGGADGNATARVSIGDLVAKADEGFRTVEAEGQISFEDPAIWLPKAVRHDTVRRKAAAEAVAKALEGFPGVAAVIPWRDGGVAESAPFREAVALSLRDESSGDLYVLLSDGALYQYRSPPDFGTSHGTPYDYDALVPLLAVGAGIVPNGAPPQVDVRQIAPTVAALLGARAPKDAQLGGVEAMLAK
jgi:hypothetical protein